MRSFSKIVLRAVVVFAMALWGLAASPAHAGGTVTVPAQGSPAENGGALLLALGKIQDASASNRYLLQLSPGTYDLGASSLVTKPYTDIEGAGSTSTTIQGQGYAPGPYRGVVETASNMELRDLQIRSDGGGTFGTSVALLIRDANPILRRVAISSSNATETNYGIRHIRSSARLYEVSIDVQGGHTAIGISNTSQSLPLSPSIEHSIIKVSGAHTMSIGISSLYMAKLENIRDLQIHVAGINSIGIRLVFPYSAPSALDIAQSSIEVSGSSSAVGLLIEWGNILIFDSEIQATSPKSSVGVAFTSTASGRIDLCRIAGATNTIIGHAPDVLVGNSHLAGGPAIGTRCANVTDENYISYTNTCP